MNIDRPAFLVKAKSLREILSDLRKAEIWLMVAALAAFFASAFFVVKYFVGGEMTPGIWTSEQWVNAALGLGITAVITAAQAFLYASGYKGHAALIATFIVVFFGVFSEVSQSMEREDATVRSRSQNSAVFQATLGSINTLSTAPQISSAASSELARAEQKAMEIQTRIDNKNRCKSCEGESFKNLRSMLAKAKGRVAAAKSRADIEVRSANAANAAALQQAINTAKQLEYDEDKHYAMIRLLKDLFGVTGIWASFLFSIIIIGTFEYAFHFVGAYVSDHKKALLKLGRDSQGRRLDSDDSPVDVSTQDNDGQIPSDHNNTLRDEYLDWVPPERNEHAKSSVSDTQNTQTPEQRNGLILIWEKIGNGEITLFNKQNGDTGQINAALSEAGIGGNDPARRKKGGLIDWILEQLVIEGVLSPSGNAPNHKIQYVRNNNAPVLPPNSVSDTQHAKIHDFTQKRFFKLIYTEVRNLILNGDVKPTVGPVTDAVTTIIRHKSHLLGVRPSMMGKPQRQQIAQSILEHLESEAVVARNNDGGIGQPKYVLAPKYLKHLEEARKRSAAQLT